VTLADAIGYADNPEKSNGYEFVKSYGCDYYTAASEFALTKSLYHNVNGREQERDVIAFHLRQSFKPGEIEPAKALEIGYELAMKFTHGKHQFVVAVHTDKEHIHRHCIFNSVTLNGAKKFRDFKRSDRALARISDHLCVENGLSIIENRSTVRATINGSELTSRSAFASNYNLQSTALCHTVNRGRNFC
jgi:hypothetical protein